MSDERIMTDDELYHFKYLSKKKIKGKWRYYYDKASDGVKDLVGYDEKEDYEKAKKAEVAAEKKANAAMKTLDAYKKNTASINAQTDTAAYYNKLINEKTLVDDALKKKKQLLKAVQKTDKMRKKYAKTPIGQLSKLAKAGSKYVNKLFSKK